MLKSSRYYRSIHGEKRPLQVNDSFYDENASVKRPRKSRLRNHIDDRILNVILAEKLPFTFIESKSVRSVYHSECSVMNF